MVFAKRAEVLVDDQKFQLNHHDEMHDVDISTFVSNIEILALAHFCFGK